MIFIIAALAVWRISHMIANEYGPFEMFERLQSWAGVKVFTHDETNTPIGNLLLCPLCLSVWFAIPFAVWLGGDTPVLWWLGLSGAASALELLLDHLDRRD